MKETGSQHVTPYMSMAEIRDGQLYRLTFLTDRLAHFLRNGFAVLTQTEKQQMYDYLGKLKDEGLLDNLDEVNQLN